MTAPSELSARYRKVSDQVRSADPKGPRGSKVVLIAVSKKKPAEAIEALYALGHRDFGENYVQELVDKARELEKRGCKDIRWHFIGHLQTNKAKALVPYVHAVHSVDSEKLAQELAKRWKSSGRPGKLRVFLQVNVDEEESKSGVTEGTVRELAEKVSALPELELAGLMTIPAAEQADPATPFRKLRALSESCQGLTQGALSMGMSGDFEVAVREGSTHVRVGTALFGER